MYVSKGREPRAFTVNHPDALFGKHRELISDAMENEHPLVTIYCPVWKGGNGVWGHKNPRASSAVCLTNHRLLISVDFHNRRPPEIHKIPHNSILSLEIGQALLAGWFRCVCLKDEDTSSSIDILFNSQVITTFERLIFFWRGFCVKGIQKDFLRINQKTDFENNRRLPGEIFTNRFTLPAVIKNKKHKTEILSHKKTILVSSLRYLIIFTSEAAPDPNLLTFAESKNFLNLNCSEIYPRFVFSSGDIYLRFSGNNRQILNLAIYPDVSPEIRKRFELLNKNILLKKSER
ncbi:MAG: hypothetical protein GXO77_09630 [Calditrichaeota bacterium]|nr:hypothetical protein [Calditrichota bacterium]